MSKKRRKKPPVRKEGSGNIENKQVRKSESSSTDKTTRRKPAPRSKTTVRRKKVAPTHSAKDMIFGRENYIMMIAGLVIILIGFLLMQGGQMPDDNTWDDSIIYSARRITIAPILILLGLIIEIAAIFRKSNVEETATIETAQE